MSPQNDALEGQVREMEHKFMDTREELQKALKKLTIIQQELLATKSNAQSQAQENMSTAGK